MKVSKKHIILGIICLASVFLQGIVLKGISVIVFIPYVSFCLCSFVIASKPKTGRKTVTVLLIGLILLPVFDLIYSMLTASLMTTLIADILIIFIQTCIYLMAFILTNSYINKEKIPLSLLSIAFLAAFVLLYSILEGLQTLAFTNAIEQATEQGALYDWLSAMNGNVIFNILSQAIFYTALFGASIRFVKEK